MSAFSQWSYTADLTVWPRTFDKSGQPTAGAPTVIKGTWIQGGDIAVDADGNEFAPRSTFWFESEPADAPERDWLILPGSYAGAPPANAEIIRVVRSFDDTTHGADGPPDYQVMT